MPPLILTFFCTLYTPYAEIRVVDEAGRGVPLVELETVSKQIFVTDNAGRVAFQEPDLMGREVWFNVRSHGYEVKADGFGMAGAKVTPVANEVRTIKVRRTMVAQRVGRLTGEGLWRDSSLLGYVVPQRESVVTGQDSVQVATLNGKRFWFWGDTMGPNYPLGNYRSAGATTLLMSGDADPMAVLNFDYFKDAAGQARAMAPMPARPEGIVWLDGVCTVKDDSGKDRLVAHFSRRLNLSKEIDHGIAVYNPGDHEFDWAPQMASDRRRAWRHPSGQATLQTIDGRDYVLFGNPVPTVRVRARLADILDPDSYEAFTNAGNKDNPDEWKWQKAKPPWLRQDEESALKAEVSLGDQHRFLPANVANTDERVALHSGTVRWNDYRKCYVLIGCQIGGKESHLGEIWYAEALEPTGPFTKAVKIVTHNKQTFYNVCHHTFLDRDGGRTIYFEGTYTEEFSGSKHFTPRYDYNQVLYKLELSAPELLPARIR